MSTEQLKDAIVSGEEETMKESLRAVVREQVSGAVNEQEQLDESFAAALLGIAGLGAGWGWIRNKVRKYENQKALEAFIEEYDTNKIINKKLPETLKRFKMVSNLTDLENMESKIEQMLNQLENMVNRVDQFVDGAYRDEKSVGDKVLIRNPQKEKQRMKSFIKDFVDNARKTFEQQVESKKDDLMS